MIIKDTDLELLLKARHYHPHAVLGLHPATVGQKKGLVARAFLDDATSCEVVDLEHDPEKRYPLKKEHKAGFFEGFIADRKEPFRYRLRIEKQNGEIRQFWDPYAFLPTIGEEDLYLFGQGDNHFVYRKLGSHVVTHNGVQGVSFAVWAPSAKRISVVGEFNHWDGRFHPMRALGSSGVWEIFIPGLEVGAMYKYEIVGGDGYLRLKTDPYAVHYEPPPHNASIVWDLSSYEWGDEQWLAKRSKTNYREAPVSVYEVHLGSWKRVVEDGFRPLTYREMASELADYVKKMGFTHVEFMPPAEHPFSGSWGYQVTGFFAPTHRFGTPQDFMYLVDYLHQHNIGVIIDWVPAHFPKDAFALAEFDGTCLYEHADPRQGQHMDWGTLIFNYGRNEVKNFLIASALAWFDRFHIDGMRVDAVASMLYLDYSRNDGEWIPNRWGGRENVEAIEFMRTSNHLVHHYNPGAMMIAEESTAFGGVTKPITDWGLGFDFKWNMGWMHDNLEYFKNDPINRKYHHNQITFAALYQWSEAFMTVFSHDEVVHGKGSMIIKMGAGFQIERKARDLRSLYAWMWLWPGKKCLFMGQEFGQSEEWKYDGSLQWHLLQYLDHEGTQRCVADLNKLYRNNPALGRHDCNPDGFRWINGGDWERSVLSFLRFGDDPTETLAVVGNFTPVDRHPNRIGVPYSGHWKELFNSNAAIYGGNDLGNDGGVNSDPEEWDGQPHSIEITLPGLSVLVFKYEGDAVPGKE